MKTITYLANYPNEKLIKDIVLDADGYWGIDENLNLIRNGNLVTSLSNEITLSFPFFRKFDENSFLIIDGEHYENDKNNAWIISKSGEIIHKFYVGKGAYKVLVVNRKIIIAYSDALIDCCPIGHYRLVVFDEKGNILRKIDHELGLEVKAICPKNKTEIYIQELYPPYITHLNLETGQITKYESPITEYADIITYSNDTLYLGFNTLELVIKSTDEDEIKNKIKNGKMNIYKSTFTQNQKIELELIGDVDYQINCVTLAENGALVFTDYQVPTRDDNNLKIWVLNFL